MNWKKIALTILGLVFYFSFATPSWAGLLAQPKSEARSFQPSGIEIGGVHLTRAKTPYPAAGTGSLSGTVRDEAGNPLEGIWVNLNVGEWEWLAGTETNASGFYRFENLEAGAYHLHIGDGEEDASGRHFIRADLYDIMVEEGEETTGADIELKEAALIYGYVKDSAMNPIRAGIFTETSYRDDQYGGASNLDRPGQPHRDRGQVRTLGSAFSRQVLQSRVT